MCGVAGIYAYSADAPPVDEHALLAVRDSIVARGPDDAGLWIGAGRNGSITANSMPVKSVAHCKPERSYW